MDDPGSWCLIIATVSTLLTLLFSTGNLALRHISWVKIEEAFEARKSPTRAEALRKSCHYLISSTAVMRLCANSAVLLSIVYWFALDEVDHHNVSIFPFIIAFVITAVLLTLFSVSIPHAWAQYAGTSFIVFAYPYLKIIGIMMFPLVLAFRFIDPVIRRLAGVSTDKTEDWIDEKQEELLNAVEEGEKEGVVDEEEREMIESVLEFRDMTAGEIMTPRTEVVGIEAKSTLTEAVEVVVNQGHSRYPVYEESIDKVIGLLYAKDLLRELNHPDGSGDIKHRLRNPFFVPESKSLRDLLHDFQNQKVHLAVVLDEYGGTAGLVTIEDILEELVGEIEDEYEVPQSSPIKQIDDNTFEIDARFDVDELNDEFDLSIPENDDYETIGGFVFAKLGSIPKTGETFDHDNLRFTVLDAGDRKINRVRIEVAPEPTTNQE